MWKRHVTEELEHLQGAHLQGPPSSIFGFSIKLTDIELLRSTNNKQRTTNLSDLYDIARPQPPNAEFTTGRTSVIQRIEASSKHQGHLQAIFFCDRPASVVPVMRLRVSGRETASFRGGRRGGGPHLGRALAGDKVRAVHLQAGRPEARRQPLCKPGGGHGVRVRSTCCVVDGIVTVGSIGCGCFQSEPGCGDPARPGTPQPLGPRTSGWPRGRAGRGCTRPGSRLAGACKGRMGGGLGAWRRVQGRAAGAPLHSKPGTIHPRPVSYLLVPLSFILQNGKCTEGHERV
jgi:hypothetical protein